MVEVSFLGVLIVVSLEIWAVCQKLLFGFCYSTFVSIGSLTENVFFFWPLCKHGLSPALSRCLAIEDIFWIR